MTKLERIILRSAPIAFLIRESHKWVIRGFSGVSVYDATHFFLKQVKKLGLTERAAAISFNLIMALPAAVLFLFSLIPYLPESGKLQTQISGLLKDIAPNSETSNFINNIVYDLSQQHVGLFSFGFLLLIFYASNAMMGIIRTFDKSIQEQKNFIFHKRWRAIRLTFILIILILLSTALLLVGKPQLTFILRHIFHMRRADRINWWNGIRWFILLGLLFYGIAFIYKFAPSVKKRWKLLSPGSILATILTLTTTVLFSYWVNNFASYNKVYGSIGTVLIIMILIYLNSLILLIGFELNVSITYLAREDEEQRLKKMSEEVNEMLDIS